jgi:hypothetical protein
MKRFTLLVSVTLLSAFGVTGVFAEETLDTLLPSPFWLRSRAEELNIDAQTRERLELTYQEKEPTYHEIKGKVERLTKRLYTALVADALDEDMIVKRMKALLEVENELKLYQIHVRISLLSQISAEQRRAVRDLAKWKLEGDWRGAMFKKVERVRQLGKRLKDSGGSVTEIEKRMKETDKMIAAGTVTKAARMLDQVIRDLEKSLEKKAGQK